MAQHHNEGEFVRLILLHQKDLFRYIVSLVPSLVDAQEVMQETSLALWHKFEQYDQGQPFVPWAKKFAYFEALRFCRARSKYLSFFSDDLLHRLAQEREDREKPAECRREALRECLAHLPAADRDILDARYEGEAPLTAVADSLGRSVHMLKKSLVHIRRRLLDCVQRRLAEAQT